jgi:hypothetical protein
MSIGKSIRIYLADGSATGIRHAEVVNWTGQAIACPRNRVSELAEWQESKRPGVYILFGVDDEIIQQKAYIGEAENVLDRLQIHITNKDFWNEAIFFTNKDENLTKAHVKYLESRFIALASSAGRYLLENGTAPSEPSLPRGDKDAMEQFIEQARGLLGVLGHKLLESLTKTTPTHATGNSETINKNNSNRINPFPAAHLWMNVSGIDARAMLTDEGIVVLAGSHAAKKVRSSLHTGYKKLRENLIAQGNIVEENGVLTFFKDTLFSTPSPAAAVIVGYPINGRKTWKNENGKTLAELEETLVMK